MPECSPPTSSSARIVTPFVVAQSMFCWISLSISAWVAYTG